jgi:hypothetical protein
MSKEHLDARINCELLMFTHFFPLIIRKGLFEFSGNGTKSIRKCFPNCCSVFLLSQWYKQGISGCALNQRSQGTLFILAQDQIPFPMEWLEGFSYPSEVYLGSDDSGKFDLYAGQTMRGVIAWWKYKRPEHVKVPDLYPIRLTKPSEWSERNERKGWFPKNYPQLQPAYFEFQPNPELIGIPILLYLGYKIIELFFCPPLVAVTP